MVGRRLVPARVVSGRRGFVVEIDRYAIARRKLGYSMGLILDARGRHPVDLLGDGLFLFYTLNFTGSSPLWERPELG